MENLEKKMSAVQALFEHINDFVGVESMYAGAARAQDGTDVGHVWSNTRLYYHCQDGAGLHHAA